MCEGRPLRVLICKTWYTLLKILCNLSTSRSPCRVYSFRNSSKFGEANEHNPSKGEEGIIVVTKVQILVTNMYY
jgi:hypothetical protein